MIHFHKQHTSSPLMPVHNIISSNSIIQCWQCCRQTVSSAYILTQRLWFVVPSDWYINMNCISMASGSTVLRSEVVIMIQLLSGWAVIPHGWGLGRNSSALYTTAIAEGIQHGVPLFSNINWYSTIHRGWIKSVMHTLSNTNWYQTIHAEEIKSVMPILSNIKLICNHTHNHYLEWVYSMVIILVLIMTNAATYIVRKSKPKHHFYIPLWSEASSCEVNVFLRQSAAQGNPLTRTMTQRIMKALMCVLIIWIYCFCCLPYKIIYTD